MYAQSALQGSRHRVLLTHPVSEGAMARLQTFFDVEMRIADAVPGRDELVGWLHGKAGVMADTRFTFDADLVRQLPSLKAICNLDAGHENLDLDALTRAGIRATSTPGAGSAQLAMERKVAQAWGGIERLLVEAMPPVSGEGRYSSRWSRRVLLAAPASNSRLGFLGEGAFADALSARARTARVQLLKPDGGDMQFWRDADLVVCAGDEGLNGFTQAPVTAAMIALMKPGASVFNLAGCKALAADVLQDSRYHARILNGGSGGLTGAQAVNPSTLNCSAMAAEDLIASLGFGRNSWHPQHLLNPDILCDSCC